MEFTLLPWFIRYEIIRLVIENHPHYCLVNREWFNHFITRNGKLFFNHQKPSSTRPKSSFTQFYQKVWFYRDFEIDWELINKLEKVCQVAIEVSEGQSRDLNEFIINCLQFPSLTHLKLQIDVNSKLSFKPILINYQNQLEELSVESDDKTWYYNLEGLAFQNLTKLELSGDIFSLETNIINNSMPKLNKLKLNFPTPSDTTLFKNQELPNIIELELDMFYTEDDALPRLDLSGFPNLKKLHLCGSFLFSDTNLTNKIEELKIGGSAEYLSRHVYNRFTNLKRLHLSIDEDPDITDLHNVFNSFQPLTELHMDFWFNFDHLISLPVGPYDVTNLSLRGRFSLTSNLLRWLSDNFKLKKLTLHGCYLEATALSELLPFKQLNHLTIRTDPKFRSQFDNYFNRANYPHLIFIENKTCQCLNSNFQLGLGATIPPLPSLQHTDRLPQPLPPTSLSNPYRHERSTDDKLTMPVVRVVRRPASSCCIQ